MMVMACIDDGMSISAAASGDGGRDGGKRMAVWNDAIIGECRCQKAQCSH